MEVDGIEVDGMGARWDGSGLRPASLFLDMDHTRLNSPPNLPSIYAICRAVLTAAAGREAKAPPQAAAELDP